MRIQWRTEKRKVKDLKSWEKNPRTITPESMKRLKSRIEARGMHDVLKINTDGTILSGNQRKKALTDLGIEEVTVMLPERKLSDKEMRLVAIESNRNDGEWDNDLLKAFGEGLLGEAGFMSEEIDDIFDEIIEPDEKDDAIPDNAPTRCKAGDIWQLGRHRLMCGDSTKREDVDRLMDGKKAQFFMSDPPYNVEYTGGSTNKKERNDTYADKKSEEQYTHWLTEVLKNGFKISDDKTALHLWFAGSKIKSIVDACFESKWFIRNLLIWNKLDAHYGALGARYKEKKEPLFYCTKERKSSRWYGKTNETTVWDEKQPSKNELHPTMKPVALYIRSILNHSQKEDIIYEAFGGSGTTLIAAEKTGRICYGMEIDPHYCDVIIQRYEKYANKKARRSSTASPTAWEKFTGKKAKKL